MFCPQCKAEYREGFTTCADCNVPLVVSLATTESNQPSSAPTGPLVPLWEGEDLALHSSLLEKLDSEKIAYLSKPLGIYPGVRRADPFPIQPLTAFGYKVAVLSSDFAAAKLTVENLLSEEPANMELAEPPESKMTGPEVSPHKDEAPTTELWHGTDEKFSGFLQDALRENEILSRSDVTGSERSICVRPSDTPRAEEILRELTEGAPPR